jgi:hypothetical protein
MAARVQERLAAMPQEWWEAEVQGQVNAAIGGRESNLKSTKPGVNTMFLIFSTRSADRIWQLPLYGHFQAQLEPLLRAAIGPVAMRNIVRLQMAQMTAGAHIKKHRDAGPWAHMCGSVHLPCVMRLVYSMHAVCSAPCGPFSANTTWVGGIQVCLCISSA